MAKLKLLIELDYDQDTMHANEPDAVTWFFKDILGNDELFLHSNEIGDLIGTVKILEIDPEGVTETGLPDNRVLGLAGTQVLEIIDPADPDNLKEVDAGLWQAIWFPPILGGDIEALKRTPGIEIVRLGMRNPGHLSGWEYVYFIILPEALSESGK